MLLYLTFLLLISTVYSQNIYYPDSLDVMFLRGNTATQKYRKNIIYTKPIITNNGMDIKTDAPQDVPCTTDSGDLGVCVPHYLCDSNENIINRDRKNVTNIRKRIRVTCQSYLDTCCLPPDIREQNTKSINKFSRDLGCGWRNPNGIGMRIVGNVDHEAMFAEFPWMVAILQRDFQIKSNSTERYNYYIGGGSLIHPGVVLTGAHVVNKVPRIRVRAGEWDTQTTSEIYKYQDRDVSEVRMHKDFNSANLFYSVALLFLNTPMKIAPNVNVVCLPPPRVKVSGGTRCLASGWGKDKFGKKDRYQVILKKVDIPVVERNTCVQQLRRTRLGKYFELHSSFMCAGGEPGKDTCKGDGGSPLVCPMQDGSPDRYVQNGIVAWGIGCGNDGTPAVYLDVANVREWIDNAVASLGYDTSTYTY